jgi:tetratricopeptide (TPR) repeat protein
MTQLSAFNRNAFHNSVLNFEKSEEHVLDLFSKALFHSSDNMDWKSLKFQFTQVFEPGVLWECAALEGLDIEDICTLAYQPSSRMRALADIYSRHKDLDFAELVNLSALLISICRFDLASEMAAQANAKCETPEQRFELHWTNFLISNRVNDGSDSIVAFAGMLDAVESGSIPIGRVLDACTQGIVWYLKRKEISEKQYGWCVETGNKIVSGCRGLAATSTSAWYRGYAMVPAAARDAKLTRVMMERAFDSATLGTGMNGQVADQNLLKTYYESALKEYTYVAPDLAKVEATGQSLLQIDPHWSPSYGEIADSYLKFGELEKAAALYEKAVEMGPPYVGHHLLALARCNLKIGRKREASGNYRDLLRISPGNSMLLQELSHASSGADHVHLAHN